MIKIKFENMLNFKNGKIITIEDLEKYDAKQWWKPAASGTSIKSAKTIKKLYQLFDEIENL